MEDKLWEAAEQESFKYENKKALKKILKVKTELNRVEEEIIDLSIYKEILKEALDSKKLCKIDEAKDRIESRLVDRWAPVSITLVVFLFIFMIILSCI